HPGTPMEGVVSTGTAGAAGSGAAGAARGQTAAAPVTAATFRNIRRSRSMAVLARGPARGAGGGQQDQAEDREWDGEDHDGASVPSRAVRDGGSSRPSAGP